MKNKKKIIISTTKVVIAALLFVFLIIPAINPFLNDELKVSVGNEIKHSFGILTDETSSGWFTAPKIITAIAVALFVYIVTVLICFIIELVLSPQKRGQTVAGLVSSIIKVVGAILGIVWVLSVLGVNLTAIFASLGVVSLILGFGVQSLIEDCVTGIFIIIEGQYNIGDIIVLEDFRGTVQRISMRTTTIRDDGGNLKIINNSDIRNIQNRSNNNSFAVCDVGVSYSTDLRKLEALLEKALPEIYERNSDIFEAQPTYSGVQSLGSSAVVVRVVVSVREQKIFPATRRLNREMKLLFDDNGIEIPFNQLVVHNAPSAKNNEDE